MNSKDQMRKLSSKARPLVVESLEGRAMLAADLETVCQPLEPSADPLEQMAEAIPAQVDESQVDSREHEIDSLENILTTQIGEAEVLAAETPVETEPTLEQGDASNDREEEEGRLVWRSGLEPEGEALPPSQPIAVDVPSQPSQIPGGEGEAPIGTQPVQPDAGSTTNPNIAARFTGNLTTVASPAVIVQGQDNSASLNSEASAIAQATSESATQSLNTFGFDLGGFDLDELSNEAIQPSEFRFGSAQLEPTDLRPASATQSQLSAKRIDLNLFSANQQRLSKLEQLREVIDGLAEDQLQDNLFSPEVERARELQLPPQQSGQKVPRMPQRTTGSQRSANIDVRANVDLVLLDVADEFLPVRMKSQLNPNTWVSGLGQYDSSPDNVGESEWSSIGHATLPTVSQDETTLLVSAQIISAQLDEMEAASENTSTRFGLSTIFVAAGTLYVGLRMQKQRDEKQLRDNLKLH